MRANLKARQIALAVAPCEFSTWPANPLRRLRVSSALAVAPCEFLARSRCGAVRFFYVARELCGDCARRIALAVAPCEFQSSPTNPLRRLCVSNRSRCGAVRILKLVDEPSAEIARVESLSLWRRANFKSRRRTLCGDCACRIALAVVFAKFKYKSSARSTLPRLRPENRKFEVEK